MLSVLAASCGGGGSDSPAVDERLAGGDTTVFSATSNAFSTPAPNLSGEALEFHLEGDAAFEQTFVTAPAVVNGGLGPVFNNTACSLCHPRDGRGRAPEDGDELDSMLVRVSIGNDEIAGPTAVPGLGVQAQTRAVFGADPEIGLTVHYEEREELLDDGAVVRLRKPVLEVTEEYTPLPEDVMFSARVAPPVFGRGLLEAVPDDLLLSLADENDKNGDGISGRPNWVWDAINGGVAIGRFGLKANTATLLQQSAAAYVEDMGVTNAVFPHDTAAGQGQDDGLPDDPELPDGDLEAVTFYTRTLGVPARRDVDDPTVREGQALFKGAGCATCHTPMLRTRSFPDIPEISGQTIFPYTDLLIHDMGGDLADERPDFTATGREWRTPPLWGVGLTLVVNGHMELLHDGRARSLMEAVMWHGGEALEAREAVRAMTRAERDALLSFLASL